jgi:hypothetical protein
MNGRLMRLSPLLSTVLAPLGWVLVWLAERIWPGTAAATALAALGAAAVVAALALNLPHFRELREARGLRGSAGWLVAPHALSVLALALYYAGRALPVGAGSAVDWPALAMGGWVLSLLCAAVLFTFVTLARLAQRRLPHPDARRIQAAGSAGLSLGLLLLLVVLLVFVFTGLPWQWNVAYFRIARPGEATRELVQSLAEPVQVGVFSAADSDVTPLLASYFDALAAQGGTGKLEVQRADAELKPALAESYKARGNGWVVLRKGEVQRPIFVGDTIERARTALRTFDRTFFQRLLELSQPKATIYLSVGHGERTEQGGKLDAVSSMGRFRTSLRARNYTVKELGLNEGLAEAVPDDAALVVIAAPRQPFPAAEAESLRRYLDDGGALLAFLEPGKPDRGAGLPGTRLEDLLVAYGVTFDPVQQVNDRVYARRTYTKADRALLVTVGYQDHPSVSTLHRMAGQFPLLLLGAGSLSIGTVPEALTAQATIQGMPGTWGDVNGDFEFEPGSEQRGVPTLAVAVTPKGRRPLRRFAGNDPRSFVGPTLIAFADADLAGDLLLQNRANLQAIDNALDWLVKRNAPTGLPESEEDVRIQHAKGDDWLWFYLPVLGVPVLVLGIGLLRVTRVRRRRSRAGREDA